MRGKFIVIEGLDGAGKSTAIQYVLPWLNQHGIQEILTTREPGGTPLAEKLRQMIKHEPNLTPTAELLLLYASRTQLVETVIQPALEQGKWVVGDRHDWSTLAYQGGGRGMDLNTLQNLRQMALGDFQADFTLYLDIDPKLGLQRAKNRETQPNSTDRFEQQQLAFFKRVRQQYLALACNNPKAVVIDASQELTQVQEQIRYALEIFLASNSHS